MIPSRDRGAPAPLRAPRDEAPEEPARRARVLDALVVCLPGALAGSLALVDLGARSIWIDEAASVTIASEHGAALGAAMARDGGNMLVYYALLHVLVGAFGRGVLVLRAPSAVATAATVALVSALANRLYGRRVALGAGVLGAVSLPLVYWGQQARAYALLVALVSGSYLAFVVVLDRAPGATIPRAALVAYVVTSTLALYMSFVAALALAAQLVVVASRRERVRAVVGSLVVVAVLSVPLLVLARARGSGQLFWVPRPSASQLGSIVATLTSAAFTPNFPRTATSSLLEWGSVALLALLVVAPVLSRGASRRGGRLPPETGPARVTLRRRVLLSWVLVPVVLAVLESVVGQPIADPRNLLVSIPPVAVALAAVALGGEIRGGTSRRSVTVGWLVVAALVGLRALQLEPSYGVSPENWRAAVRFVLAGSRPGDCVAFYPEDGRMAFSYYLPGPSARAAVPRAVLPAVPWSDGAPFVERYETLTSAQVASVASGCARLYLVASHEGQVGGPPVSVAHLLRYESLESELAARYARRAVYRFGYAAVVTVTLYSR
ncbi:MAG: glycosyltransferase family 39 protein [Actinomycetota bacterium]|nr:glycosyltransferase family 39 protein [Actinomycetota bacterium]